MALTKVTAAMRTLGSLEVDTANLAADAVDGSKISVTSEAQGDLMWHDGTNWARVAKGTAGQTLQGNTTSIPTWVDAGGKVLQVVEFNHQLDGNNSSTSTTSTSYVTIFSGSITPSSANSKVMVLFVGSVYANGSTAWSGPDILVNVVRGSTEMWDHSSGSYIHQRDNVSSAKYVAAMANIKKLDSPATTSSTTYTVKMKMGGSSAAAYMYGATLTLLEIGE